MGVQLCLKFISRKSLELGGRIDGSNLPTRVLMLASLSSQLESFTGMQNLIRESKPEDWDDEMDGEWEPPMIDNPEYKGEWKPRQIDNPDYKGAWVHPEIDNPDYNPADAEGIAKYE